MARNTGSLGEGVLLSRTDLRRLERSNRLIERKGRMIGRQGQRRRGIIGGAGGDVQWFLLTSVAVEPMIGSHRVWDSTTSAWGVGSLGEVDIYPHPASNLDNYQTSYVPAIKSGGRWFAMTVTNAGYDVCGDSGS